MMDRLTTGIPQLDEILDGGIPRYAVVFVAGLPGTGKTILSEQCLFANARQGLKSLYLSTISEPPIKVLRFLQGFDFFDPTLFGDRVIYGDLGTPLREGGPARLLDALDQMVREHRPEIVVIDSFKALRDTIRDPLQFRDFTSDIAIHLSTWEVNALLVGEYTADDVREGPEFAIADGIIYLYGTEEAEKQKRFLRVMKMRGTGYFAGEHFFTINSHGIAVYPRIAPQVVGEYRFPGQRLGSAIAGMDEMLGGGPYEGTSTLISGGTGAGKSLLALSFLIEGARRGLPGLLVTFEESPKQMARNVEAFGWGLEDLMRQGLLDIYHVSPSELDIDRHAYVIQERARQLKAKIVAVDSVTAFSAAVPDRARYQSYLWGINDYFKRQGISIFMTSEVPTPFAALEISAENVSFVSDNVIFVRYVEVADEIKRAVGVLKMRGSRHDHHLRELIIEPPRIAIGAPLGQIGVLGVATRGGAGEEAAERKREPVRA